MKDKNKLRPVENQNDVPPFYKSISALSCDIHKNLNLAPRGDYSFAAETNELLLATDEFKAASKHYPILFRKQDGPVPVALVGLFDGYNQYVSKSGHWKRGAYIPVYVRRYPFLLLKNLESPKNRFLCFDEGSASIAEGGGDGKLFVDGEPSGRLKAVIQLCDWYEQALKKSDDLVRVLKDFKLLVDAHTGNRAAARHPELFSQYQIVCERSLVRLPEPALKALSVSGLLSNISSHLISLGNIETLFSGALANDDVSKGARRK